MRYKACIFDLDGTTTDSVGAIAHTANLVLEKYGLPAQPEEAYKHFAGDGQFELIKRALRAAGDTKLEYYDAVMADYIEEFRTGCTYNVVPYDGILPMLEELKHMGIKTATLSNKRHDNVIHVVETVFGDGLFDVVMGQSDDIPKNRHQTEYIKFLTSWVLMYHNVCISEILIRIYSRERMPELILSE